MAGSSTEWATRLFTSVMQQVDVRQRMRSIVFVEDAKLRVGEQQIDLGLFRRVLLASIGKAAVPMAEHMIAVLADTLPFDGLVVGPGSWTGAPGVRYIQGDHPVPSEASYRAGKELLALARTADRDTLVLFLISGGASALAEVPLDPAISSEDMSLFYGRLLHAGLPIERTNLLRKHFSAIKGGRLAAAAGNATRCTLLISDVPPGKLNVVGSGPSLLDTSTVEQRLHLLAEMEHVLTLPESLRRFSLSMPETPRHLPEGRVPALCIPILSSDSLIEAASAILSAEGYRVIVDNSCDDWDYRAAAEYLIARAVRASTDGKPVCILSAGEVTVAVQGEAGLGGRNLQWALEAARLIKGRKDCSAMSVGSDGIDGNSPVAGAVVDGSSWRRALAAGFDPQRALDTFNAYPLFAAIGDSIRFGHSGNNIRDLRVVTIP